MYRKQEWESSSRADVVPQARTAEGHVSEGHDPERLPDSVPPRPMAEARLPSQPNPAQASPIRTARPQRYSRRTLALGAALVLAVGAGGWFGYHWLTVGRFTVSTDDAYVGAYNTTLAAKVSGYVANVAVTDNAQVHAGDVIATLDDGDYRLAVQSARDKTATQEATIARIGHQVEAQQAAVAQAQAQLVSAQAGAKRMELELTRQTMLVARDASSRQLLEQAQANRDQGTAAVQSAQAAIETAIANVEVLKGQRQEAVGTLDELKASLGRAERDLSFTVIRAPIDGVIGNRAIQTGDFVQPGQRLASLVPLGDVYVDANFKETQLAELRPGQPASVAIDALPEHAVRGTVESFAPASGSVFSLLPPDNA